MNMADRKNRIKQLEDELLSLRYEQRYDEIFEFMDLRSLDIYIKPKLVDGVLYAVDRDKYEVKEIELTSESLEKFSRFLYQYGDDDFAWNEFLEYLEKHSEEDHESN